MALQIGTTYYIKNVATGKYLNVYGTDTVANSRNVNTYAKEDCLAQKWTVGLYGDGARVYTAINSAYALNINTSNNNCTMYAAASNSEEDSVVDFLTVSATNNQYRIKMMAHNKYLSVTTSDDNAYWASSADSYSLWQLEEVSSSGSSSLITTTAPSAIVDQTFFVKNYNTGYNLNIYGTDTVADGRNVNVYSKENCLAQKWIVRQKSGGAKLCTTINEAFALNINTGDNNNCTMYTESGNDADSVLEFIPYTDASVTSADKVYYIKMANHNLYLDVESIGSGVNAYWVSGTSGYSLWQFLTEADIFPTALAAPAEIVGNTFAIKANGTDLNLNVHGTDTVADGRNVNVYSKEDCAAQRWIVSQTTAGPKLLTKIDTDFSLNINTVDNNCTMYTVSGNDTDSVLEFEEVGDMLYKIKMFNHNKYLCIDETAESGANVVWSSTAITYWEFIPETTMFPVPDNAPAAIVDQPFFIKNFNTKYNLNVQGVNTVADGRNVNVYAKENVDAQKWRVINTEKGPKIITEITSSTGADFALNITSADNPNCNMYTITANNVDSVLEFEPYTDATVTAADRVYKIKMHHHGKYLDAAGVGSGYNAFWSEAPTYPLWQFVSEEEMFPPATAAHASIADKTFFIQNVNTGYYLNVHGSDTVVNTRNVNVYAKEDVQAQRWVIRNGTGGPKLHTKINEDFALNIYANDNNCTMYTEVGNDVDSVLQFIPYTDEQTEASENIYRIKMHYHNRYLTVANRNIGSNAYWTSVDTEPYALWKLIPESNMSFEVVTPEEADSPLVTSFIPAASGNYMSGRNGRRISEITIHHMAGNLTVQQLGAMWQDPSKVASSHYGVHGKQVGQYVKECDTAYTNGGSVIDPDAESSNFRAITIETANTGTTDPTWPVSDDTFYTLVDLVADIARRNNLGTLVSGQNLTWHSMYAYTTCPGDYLRSRMQDIADMANEINAAYISGRIYLRKHNTDKFFSVNENNHVVLVDKDSAQPWMLKKTDDKTYICDFTNPALKMNVDTDETTLILAEGDSNVYASFLTEKTFDICYESGTSTLTLRSNPIIKRFSSLGERLGLFDDGERDSVDSVTDVNAEIDSFTSVVPEFYQSRVVRIKHKATGKYMTYTGENSVKTDGYGISVELRDKVSDSSELSQIWKITRFGDNMFCLSTYSAANHSLELSTDNNICVSTNPGMYVPNSRVISISELSTGEFTISFPTFDNKYCRQYFEEENATNFICGSNINDSNAVWILDEPEPKSINDWLVAYYNPQDRANARDVHIPNYAYKLPLSDDSDNFEYVYNFSREDSDGNEIPFNFTNRNYWYAQESGFSSYIPEEVLNVYGVSETTLPRTATQSTYEGYYWVAVGPNVIKPNYSDEGRPGSEMYGLGTLDAVISDGEGRNYYIRCIPGDVKAHTWNNGVIQTYLRYFNPNENKDASVNQYDVSLRDDTADYITEMKKYNLDSYNKTACIEFIGYGLNAEGNVVAMPETSLNKYSIEKIIFYDNPIV